MRNFILSLNFKNSVTASFFSLVILIASLSFDCCLNASAMFDDEFPPFEANPYEQAHIAPHAYPSDGNIPPTFVASSSDITTRDEGYPSSFVSPNADGDNNTNPTDIVDLSNDVDDKTFTDHLNFLVKIPFPIDVHVANEIAIDKFPYDPDKQKAFDYKLNYFNMCVDRKRRYYEETGKGTPKNYDYQKADALKFLHGEEPDNNDSCDEYFNDKIKKLSPEERKALIEFGENLQNS